MYSMFVFGFNQETVVVFNVIPSNSKIGTFLSQTNNLWDNRFLHKKVDTPVCGADMPLKKITCVRDLKLSCKGRGEPGGVHPVKGKASDTERERESEEITGLRIPGGGYLLKPRELP